MRFTIFDQQSTATEILLPNGTDQFSELDKCRFPEGLHVYVLTLAWVSSDMHTSSPRVFSMFVTLSFTRQIHKEMTKF